MSFPRKRVFISIRFAAGLLWEMDQKKRMKNDGALSSAWEGVPGDFRSIGLEALPLVSLMMFHTSDV
ncbi:hypothetical protein EYZ11_003530 [Aspergillus tanneri]|uniref:Uncharacterized protein n=1 Tax=Aspergillus tanneri TaxID=1220188 RepID=A0A4V3UPY7_9EURO|nr:hypothetical protein EYZ11_003530 [Aspergillus tanneri]